jgi:hypothetical protein
VRIKSSPLQTLQDFITVISFHLDSIFSQKAFRNFISYDKGVGRVGKRKRGRRIERERDTERDFANIIVVLLFPGCHTKI